ncbi:MAG: hypothetical protein AMS16_02375 [Planctomycetes bacterium DG_58]|nr:MAG: hypothetical protein AMS16_02375 [Planctomycetes bacterium DG_58]KPL04371.1 MAG: hypothetical protein AMK75_01175 [Planctomycetes bacterium SM23_65]
MFTGIVQHLGRVTSAQRTAGGLVLSVEAPPAAQDARIGDSISVSGVCLTVTGTSGDVLRFDVTGETLSMTTLDDLTEDLLVNVEPSLRPSDRMGGHFVTGHIDGIGALTERTDTPGETRMTFRTDAAVTQMMILKGSVALDGVSLTLTHVSEGTFGVVLIPHTLSVTTLGTIRPGARVNIETDLIGKWVLKALGRADDTISEDFLREHGFA